MPDSASAEKPSIRANLPDGKPQRLPNWGPPVAHFEQTGPALVLPIDMNLSEQVAWLNDFQPHYLLVYPSNLAALLDEVEAGRLRFDRLRQIRSIGELLRPALRDRVKEVLGVGTRDTYSSQELGMIAAECPVTGQYHSMESLLVEVLDEQNRPCAPGITGRVVVTDLCNFSTPLIRYDIGDYAEAGAEGLCECGRGLARLGRILGRERNMLRLPDGKRRWPLVGFSRFRDIGNIVQYQVIQHDYHMLELRLVCKPQLSAQQETQLKTVICDALRHECDIRIVYFDRTLPYGAGGKFEEFICLIAN